MELHVFFLLLTLPVVARLCLTIYRALTSPLASVPGPFFARFTNLWFSIDDPFAARIIYAPGHGFPKSSWYDTWGDPNPHQWSLFSDRDERRHAANRRLYQNMYSMSSQAHYERYVDECADLFVQRLTEMSGRRGAAEPVDMGHWFQCYAFDVIGMITYSKRLGFLDRGQDVGDIIKNLDNHLRYASIVGVYSHLHPYLAPIRNRLGKKATGRKYIVDITKQYLAEHQSKPKAVDVGEASAPSKQTGTLDLLSKFFAKHSEDPTSFTQYHVLAGCVSNMVAGSDTTAVSLSATLYQLLRHPRAMEKLQSEVDQFFSLRDSDSKAVTLQESLQLPYLQAVIKESLRLHPATGLPLERVVPEGGASICGKFLPEGTIVGINSWVEHHRTSIFGDDAAEFRPERWLTTNSDRLSAMNRHWMPFGLGSRTCIGRHISMLEMCKLIPRLVHEFDFELNQGYPWLNKNCWFVKPVGWKINVCIRSPREP
ncbi:cytochrome P450 [Colletotrichum higginsianum]|uniref:Cytochrome P450 n=1 Tax=Colletotrichum higginsianum (strain IMI 349063) TaxID=759273 RepID=H1W5U9_COLHI|nr:Cytochrome P450 [Colletotrichum higginsianum IMI 349063]OBR04525.1 Cytochrome P450 [Colletotrichum higginsianum IMI 349063]CCF47863.1 cytochrome P450 [Colletotrichum higginsianum]